jgi:F0F1-type ATP synthase membrane subunit b/b'
MSTKKFLYTMFIAYAVCASVGLALFRSPSYSRQYLAKYGHEHERYHKITKNKEYKVYIERPHLRHADARLQADAAFAKDYEAREDFRAERRRMFAYDVYFKVLNSTAFIVLIARALRKPLVQFLDGKITEIRSELDSADRARAEAQQIKAAASTKMEQWAAIEEGILKDADAAIAQRLAVIRQEFEEARAELVNETADRKQAEGYRSVQTVKEELVSQAIRTLEERYRTETSQAQLAANVDRFVRFMDRLS